MNISSISRNLNIAYLQNNAILLLESIFYIELSKKIYFDNKNNRK